jgi:hypothetical protein
MILAMAIIEGDYKQPRKAAILGQVKLKFYFISAG